jgi:hypothetical protein
MPLWNGAPIERSARSRTAPNLRAASPSSGNRSIAI